jgi:hypothetical protein
MRLSDSAILQAYQDDVGPRMHDFYICYKCGRIITREQEKAVWKSASSGGLEGGALKLCVCGSQKYSPTRPHGLDWLIPRVASYTLKLVLARGLAPWLDKNFPQALPVVEFLCRPKEA